MDKQLIKVLLVWSFTVVIPMEVLSQIKLGFVANKNLEGDSVQVTAIREAKTTDCDQ